MQKKQFKVMIQGENNPTLKEVKGYFIWLNELRVFVYYDSMHRKWYVIDLETGQALATGNSMYLAKKQGLDLMYDFKKIKESKKYQKIKFQYQKLLRGELNEKIQNN